MNAVILGVVSMLLLCFARINVIFALLIGAIIAGLSSGLSLHEVLKSFNHGMESGANIALSYAFLGAFAATLSDSGVSHALLKRLANLQKKHPNHVKSFLLASILIAAIFSQNLVPIHIAFIPILIPPLLILLNQLKLDRRIISCLLIFGLCATYLVIPFGFGDIYLNKILAANLTDNGVTIDQKLLPLAMSIPVSGMFIGLLFSIFVSYKKTRNYVTTREEITPIAPEHIKQNLFIVSGIILFSLVVQIITSSILIAALAGCLAMLATKTISFYKADSLFIDGIKMMAFAGFVMMASSGLSEVLKETGEIPELINLAKNLCANNKGITAFVMLFCGLIITMGIGSSFSTVPIIAAIYVPLCIEVGFSPMATAVILGTSGALGDASSPASEATIGPTVGLNADGQHNHIKDTVLPAFLHFNIPAIIFGWTAAMIL